MTDGLENTKRVGYLDGLRGVGCLGIVSLHMLSGWLPSIVFGTPDHRFSYLRAIAHTPLSILWAGDFALMLLFIDSGYVLSNRYFCHGSRFDLVKQASKRWIRLGLPVLAATVLTALLLQTRLLSTSATAEISGSRWLLQFWRPEARQGLLWSVTGGTLFRGATWWNPTLWTISVQLAASMFILGLLLVFGRTRYRSVVFLFGATCALAFGSERYGVHFAAFILGVWFRSARAGNQEMKAAPTPDRAFRALRLIGISALIVYLGAWPNEPDLGPWYQGAGNQLSFLGSYLRPRALAHTAAAALMFHLVLRHQFLQRALSQRFLQSVGRKAFSVYLLHFPIQMSLGNAIFVRVAPRTHSIYLATTLAGIATLVVTLAVATVFDQFVDRPSRRLATRFDSWWNQPASLLLNFPPHAK